MRSAHLGRSFSGLSPEMDRLKWVGLSDSVLQTIQVARAGPTTACYSAKWLGFQPLCGEPRPSVMCSQVCAVSVSFHD